MSGRRWKHSSRSKVLAAYRRDPNATMRELAERTGLYVSSVHYHLTKADQEGAIHLTHETGNRTGKYRYRIPMEKLSQIRRDAAQKKSKSDPDLQKRIDLVVEHALSGQQSANGVDVFSPQREQRVTKGTRIG